MAVIPVHRRKGHGCEQMPQSMTLKKGVGIGKATCHIELSTDNCYGQQQSRNNQPANLHENADPESKILPDKVKKSKATDKQDQYFKNGYR